MMFLLCLLALSLASSVHGNALIGYCPPLLPGTVSCADNCAGDADCFSPDLCCSNGCANVCTPAVFVKPGSCPQMTPCNVTGFADCLDDFQCGMGLQDYDKCCQNSCGEHKCIAPVFVKPGSCPQMTPCNVTGFADCLDDFQCGMGPQDYDKCCQNSCGEHKCIAPALCSVPQLVDPPCQDDEVCMLEVGCVSLCRNVTCSAGQECQVVNGIAECVGLCDNVPCLDGQECQVVNGIAECVGTCDNVACNQVRSQCLIQNNVGTCVARTCDDVTCDEGKICQLRPWGLDTCSQYPTCIVPGDPCKAKKCPLFKICIVKDGKAVCRCRKRFRRICRQFPFNADG